MVYQLLEVDIYIISDYGQYITAFIVMKSWFLDSSYKIFIKNALPILLKKPGYFNGYRRGGKDILEALFP